MTETQTPLPVQCQCHQDQAGCPIHQAQEPTVPIAPTVTMLPVTSSNVQAVGYSPDARELHVQYKTGPTIYVHGQVPADVWATLQTVESKGSYLASAVKARYPVVRRVVPEPESVKVG